MVSEEVIHIFIYKITNTIDGKVYIGQTVRPPEKRFTRHINDAENGVLDTHFARAIRKYGEQSFSLEVIDTADSQDDLNTKEQYWIRFYDSVNNGYNETDAIYKCGGNTYLSKSKEELAEIGEKISKSKVGVRNPHARAIKCMNVKTGCELFFDTENECRKHFGEKTHRFITSRVTQELLGLFRDEWMISYADKEYPACHPRGVRRRTAVEIEDLDSGEVSIHKSVCSAARHIGVSRHKINTKKHGPEFVIDNRYKITILS